MDDDPRLNAQLRVLGKKLFQFRDLIAKMDIPESIPAPPLDSQFWENFIGKCSSAATVLKQVHSALTPDMYHLSVFPGEKIWQNPAAVPDLLSVPQRLASQPSESIASSREEVVEWNTKLEEANASLESFMESYERSKQELHSAPKLSHKNIPSEDKGPANLMHTLFTTTSRERVSR